MVETETINNLIDSTDTKVTKKSKTRSQDPEDKKKEKALKESKKDKVAENLEKVKLDNPFKSIVADNNIVESLGNNDIITSIFDQTKDKYSLEEYVKLIQKVITKIDMTLSGVILSKNSPNEVITDHLVVIKNNPGMNLTKLYYSGSKNINNLSDEYKVIKNDNLTLFEWPDRIPATENKRIETHFKVLLNVYSMLINNLFNKLQDENEKADDFDIVSKEFIGIKCGVFKLFSDFFNSSQLTGTNEVAILNKKTPKKFNVLKTGNTLKPKAASKKKQAGSTPVNIAEADTFISTLKSTNMTNGDVELPNPQDLVFDD